MKGNLTNPDGPHLSEANFRRWEAILERFLNTYPEPFVFEPSELAPSTCCVSLRNAVNTILIKDEIKTTLDRVLLKEYWRAVSVCAKGKKVVIGDRGAQREASVAIAREHSNSPGPRQLTLHNPSDRALLAVALLLLEKHLVDPVSITGDIPSFTPPSGIVFEPMPDGSFTML